MNFLKSWTQPAKSLKTESLSKTSPDPPASLSNSNMDSNSNTSSSTSNSNSANNATTSPVPTSPAASTSSSSTTAINNANTKASNGNVSSGHTSSFSTAKVSSFFSNFAAKVKTVVEEEQQQIRQFLSDSPNSTEAPTTTTTSKTNSADLHTNLDSNNSMNKAKENQFLPPWMDFTCVDKQLELEVRNQILNLTKSKRNFINAPPEDANFQFDFDAYLPIAQVSLKADPNLSNARFYLVPKYIKEKPFWRNYFYRVHIIKEAYGFNKRKDNENQPYTTNPLSSLSTNTSTSVSVPSTPSSYMSSSTSRSTSESVREVVSESTGDANSNVKENHGEDLDDHVNVTEEEFISDDFNILPNADIVKHELDQFGVTPSSGISPAPSVTSQPSTSNSKTDGWDEITQELDEKFKNAEIETSLSININEEWEEQLKKELGGVVG